MSPSVREKRTFLCEVLSNHRINREIFRLDIAWPGPPPRAGQFFLIRPERTGCFLSRPVSVALWEPAAQSPVPDGYVRSIRFMIALRGRGTAELAGLRSGDKAELTGPLGNAWTDFLPAETGGGKIALIGGGIGIAPLIALALELRDAGADFDSLRRVHTPAPWGGTGGMNPESNTLQEQHTPSACGGVVDFYAGFKTLSSNPEDTEYEDFLGPLSRHGGEAGKIVLATEDGGRGNTDPWNMGRIPDFLDPGRYRAVCACGPEPMLKVVRAKCAAAGVPCFISMERRMACGVGACLGCIVKTTGGNRRCCADGPVFPAAEILFED